MMAQGPFYLVGMGTSNRSLMTFLKKKKISFGVWDDNASTRKILIAQGMSLWPPEDVNYRDLAMVVLAPTLPVVGQQCHPVAKRAQDVGCPVGCDISVWHALGGVPNHTRVVGVTGTNGKSTTTALIGHILEKSAIPVAVGGNIGVPCCDLPPLPPGGVYVIEVSSYQLEKISQKVFHEGVVLSISPDHLDHHGSFRTYVEAKGRLSSLCRQPIFAHKTPLLASFLAEKNHRVRWLEKGTQLWEEASAMLSLPNIKVPFSLQGRHQQENMIAAYCLCHTLGVEKGAFLEALESFKGLEHRQEFVAEDQGIIYVNDSKATNATSAAMALRRFRKPVFWIVGGEPKEENAKDFMPEESLDPVETAFIMGPQGDFFEKALKNRVKTLRCLTMEDAFHKATSQAQRHGHGVVLLSPGAASFDQFENFMHRGLVFKDMVKRALYLGKERHSA